MERTQLLLDTLAIYREEWGDALAGHVGKAEARRLKAKLAELTEKAEHEAPKVKAQST